MNFIWGGGSGNPKRDNVCLELKAYDQLATYWDVFGRGRESHVVDRVKAKPKIKLMLDSGAFSAWKKGLEINLDEYIAYIKRNEKYLHTYVNLDVIPGAPGRRSTQEEVEAAAKASYRNLKKMHKAGLRPMPVFHMGESFDWLHRLLDDGEDYIGIGGMGNATNTSQIQFLDRVFTILTNSQGWPEVKTHGLGVAGFPMLKRYPWTTCDATSWVLTAAMGSIYVPITRAGKHDYSQPPVKLTVSEVDRQNGMPSDHYLKFGPMMKHRVELFLNEVGITIEEARDSYEARARAIVYFYLQFQDAIGEQPFRYRLRHLA